MPILRALNCGALWCASISAHHYFADAAELANIAV